MAETKRFNLRVEGEVLHHLATLAREDRRSASAQLAHLIEEAWARRTQQGAQPKESPK